MLVGGREGERESENEKVMMGRERMNKERREWR
jgi:hypothetical protein